jgi:hypothetical protein
MASEEDEFWQQEIEKRIQRQKENKHYIDSYLADTIQKLAIAALNERPNDIAAFMRDHLLGVEHKEIVEEYTSVKDLRDIKVEISKLRIRKTLLTQVREAVQKLQLPSISVLRQDFKEWQNEHKYPTEEILIVSDSKLQEHLDFLQDEQRGMKGDFKMLTSSIKVLLSEAQSRLAQGTVSTVFLNKLIQGLPILVERDISLGPETAIELMIRKILEEKLKMEQ